MRPQDREVAPSQLLRRSNESSYESPSLDDYSESPGPRVIPKRSQPEPVTGDVPLQPIARPTPGKLQPRAGRPSQPQPYHESAPLIRPPLVEDDDGIEEGESDIELLDADEVEFVEEGTVRARPSGKLGSGPSAPPRPRRNSAAFPATDGAALAAGGQAAPSRPSGSQPIVARSSDKPPARTSRPSGAQPIVPAARPSGAMPIAPPARPSREMPVAPSRPSGAMPIAPPARPSRPSEAMPVAPSRPSGAMPIAPPARPSREMPVAPPARPSKEIPVARPSKEMPAARPSREMPVAPPARPSGAQPIVPPPRTSRSTGSQPVVGSLERPVPPSDATPAGPTGNARLPPRPTPSPAPLPPVMISPDPLPPPPSSQLGNNPPTTPMARRSMRDPGTVITRRPGARPSLSGRALLLVVGAVAAVAIVATVTGWVLREYRVGVRIDRHREAARQRMAAGTYAGYQAAAEEYRRILVDRPSDDATRAARARIMALMAFEFGDSTDAAARAVSALGDDTSEDAQIARTYVALARGDLARARRLATQSEALYNDAAPRYLAGRLALLLDHPDDAATAIAAAVERAPSDPLLLHGLGLAEAARRHDGAAMEAFQRALDLSPNHVSTIVDRAALQIARGRELSQARLYLEGVVSKLAGEASASELGRAYLALGQLNLQNGDLDTGRAMLTRASAKRPDGDVVLSEGLAAAYLQAFELDAAEIEARRAIEAARGRSAAYLTLAQVALLRGRAQEALSDIDEAGTATPEALLVRGRAHLALGKNGMARNDLDEAVRLAPDLVEARVMRTKVDIADGRVTQAQRELEKMERAHLAPAMVAEGLAKALLAQHQPDRARYWFAKAVERNPLALDARLELARLYFDDGRTDEARAELKRAVEANAEFAPAWRELAALSLESSDLLAAREEYDALVEKMPADAAALLGAARARLLLGDNPGAEERLGRAEKYGAANEPLIAEELTDLRALLLFKSDRPGDAAALLEPTLQTAQRSETAALFVGANNVSGHPLTPRAIGMLVPERLRGTPEVWVAEARGYVELGRSSTAETMAQAALKRAEHSHVPSGILAEAHAVLGRALYDQGALKSAGHHLDEALKIDPHNTRAAYQKAILLEDRRDLVGARALLEEAVKTDPGYAEALYEVGRLRAMAGDATSADAFNAYLKLEPNGPYAADARRALGQDRPAPRPKAKLRNKKPKIVKKGPARRR
jgi:tetratricopeptide (TPR) repeat protein